MKLATKIIIAPERNHFEHRPSPSTGPRSTNCPAQPVLTEPFHTLATHAQHRQRTKQRISPRQVALPRTAGSHDLIAIPSHNAQDQSGPGQSCQASARDVEGRTPLPPICLWPTSPAFARKPILKMTTMNSQRQGNILLWCRWKPSLSGFGGGTIGVVYWMFEHGNDLSGNNLPEFWQLSLPLIEQAGSKR